MRCLIWSTPQKLFQFKNAQRLSIEDLKEICIYERHSGKKVQQRIWQTVENLTQIIHIWDCDCAYQQGLAQPENSHFLCWIPDLSQAEKKKCCYKLSKCTKWLLFHSKLSFLAKILSVARLVTTVIFFSAWDKSLVKRDNSRNSTQKIRTSNY